MIIAVEFLEWWVQFKAWIYTSRLKCVTKLYLVSGTESDCSYPFICNEDSLEDVLI